MKKISTEVVSRSLGSRLVRPMVAAGMLAAMGLAASSVFADILPTQIFDTSPYGPTGLAPAPKGTQTLYVAANTAGLASHFLSVNTQFGNITADTALKNFSVVGHPASAGAIQLVVNKQDSLIFVLNNISETVDVVEQATNTQIATLAFPTIGVNPIGIRVTPSGDQLWVANAATGPFFNNGTVVVISLVPGSTFLQPIFLINTGGSPNEVIFNSKGSAAYVLNGLPVGYFDVVSAKTFKILQNHVAYPNLNSPNPLSMDITKDNTTLYIGNADTNVNNVDITGGVVDNTIFMFPGISPAVQSIGQVLISPDQKFVVSADIDIANISVAKTATQTFDTYGDLPGGSHPYFMAFLGTTLFVSDYNATIFGTFGGNDSISVFSGL